MSENQSSLLEEMGYEQIGQPFEDGDQLDFVKADSANPNLMPYDELARQKVMALYATKEAAPITPEVAPLPTETLLKLGRMIATWRVDASLEGLSKK